MPTDLDNLRALIPAVQAGTADPALVAYALEGAAEEIGRLRGGMTDHTSAEQAEEVVATLMDAAADEITRLRAERTRLHNLVRRAFNEGFTEGMDVRHGGGKCWQESQARAALREQPNNG